MADTPLHLVTSDRTLHLDLLASLVVTMSARLDALTEVVQLMSDRVNGLQDILETLVDTNISLAKSIEGITTSAQTALDRAGVPPWPPVV